MLVGLALVALECLGASWAERSASRIVRPVIAGIAVYYIAGVAFSAAEAHGIAHGRTFAAALSTFEPWQALVLVPAAVAVLYGFVAYARASWAMSARQRAAGREAIAAAPALYTGTIPKRVRRRSPAALAGYELPLGLMGFPGVGWPFRGFTFPSSTLF